MTRRQDNYGPTKQSCCYCQVMCMYLECLLIWIGVSPDPALYKPSITHFGIFAGLLAFVLFEGFVPMSGASMSPARSWAFFLAGRMTFARGYWNHRLDSRAIFTFCDHRMCPCDSAHNFLTNGIVLLSHEYSIMHIHEAAT